MLNTCTILDVSVQADELGRAITRARDRAKLSKAELARRYDADPAVVGRFEDGQQIPTLPKLERLCAALGIDVADLLADAGIIPRSLSARDAIVNDETLEPQLRDMVLAAYEAARKTQGLLDARGGDLERPNGHGDRTAQ